MGDAVVEFNRPVVVVGDVTERDQWHFIERQDGTIEVHCHPDRVDRFRRAAITTREAP